MSRTVNEALSRRILSAAKRLWREAGEPALTIRGVAQAARTTTPSVYQRFPSKQDLIAALGDAARLQLASAVMKSGSLEHACRSYLEVAQKAPHDYKLIFGSGLPRIIGGATRRPLLEWLQERFTERAVPDAEVSAYTLFLTLHGAASMLQFAPDGDVAEEIRERCLAACDAIIRGDGSNRRRRNRAH